MVEEKKVDRRTLRSRRQMQDALLELLSEKDYDNISVADIAERASISRPTFYAHYKTKDELLLNYFDRLFESFFDDLTMMISQQRESIQVDLRDLGLLMKVVFDHWHKHRMLLKALLRSSGEGVILRRFQSQTMTTLGWLLKHEQLRPLDPRMLHLVADHMAGVSLTLIKHWTEKDFTYSSDVMGEFYSIFIRSGIEQLIEPGELDVIFEKVPHDPDGPEDPLAASTQN